MKRNVLMPLEKAKRQFSSVISGIKSGLKKSIKN